VKLRGLRVERLTVRYRSGNPQCVLELDNRSQSGRARA
jgi:hypothetical protein